MSDHIPFDIQLEIMNMLPVKSLLRFRSMEVSDSSDFIVRYRSQQHHLFVNYYDYEQKYVSIADVPKPKVSLTSSVNNMLEYHYHPRIISCSHGLVCLYSSFTRKAVVWNISIRKSIVVVVPAVSDKMFETTLGFGVCRETSDPKIIKITYIRSWSILDINATCILSQVEVFTLSTGAWRSPYGTHLRRKSIYFHSYDVVVIEGVFYWLATDRNNMNGGFRLIVSFDMTSEEFREITLPGDLSHAKSHISVSYLGNSLVVCKDVEQDNNGDLCLWMIGGGVSNSFTKLFTITPNGDATLRGFRKSGEPIIAIGRKHGPGRLAVYKPYSKRINYLVIDGSQYSFKVYPYMETLYLFGQPDNMVYNGMYSD